MEREKRRHQLASSSSSSSVVAVEGDSLLALALLPLALWPPPEEEEDRRDLDAGATSDASSGTPYRVQFRAQRSRPPRTHKAWPRSFWNMRRSRPWRASYRLSKKCASSSSTLRRELRPGDGGAGAPGEAVVELDCVCSLLSSASTGWLPSRAWAGKAEASW